MSRLRSWLDFAGRTSRLSYWRCLLIINVLGMALYVLAIIVAMAGFGGSSVIATAALVGIPLLAWPAFAVSIRRLHDRGRSAWWILIFYLLPFVLEGGAQAAMRRGGAWVLLALGLVLAALGIAIWGWIEFGFLHGTRGANRFGQEPART
jgi:uncharacterized membrane protein YhaH (DUF805 family)